MNLNTQCLDVVCTIGSSSEIGQVELDLIPAFIQTHWHGADEWLHTGCALIVRCSEASSDLLVIQNSDLKGEVLLEILDNHDKKWQLDAKRLIWICRTCSIVGADICAHNLQHR